MIEKATELGVDRILPVEAARTEKGLFEASRKRSERWARIARESSQQSRRVRIPEILPAVRFERCLEEAAEHRYFLDEGARAAAPARNSGRALRLRGPADRSRRRLDRCRTRSSPLPPPGSRSRSDLWCFVRKQPLAPRWP